VHTLDLDKPRAPNAAFAGNASAKSTLHEVRLAEVKSLDLHPLSLIFYGDSITELWRGEMVGEKISVREADCTRLEGYGDLLQDRFVARFGPAAVMAVSGDTSGDLLWRLQNGEVFSHVADAVMLHIGINDINNELGGKAYLNPCSFKHHGTTARPLSEFGNADADNVYFGIKAVVQQIMNGCQAPVVLTGLFPTGYEWPAGPYGAVIPRVNWLLQQLAAASKGRLHVIDCSWAVLNNATGKIDPELMPDYVHPSPAGGDRWAKCMSQALECKVFGSRAC
jgi:lysophospholipase L1-like esterase